MFKLSQSPRISCFLVLLSIAQSIDAKSLWASFPANGSGIINTTYPVGNGRLAAMPIGPAGHETLTLNLDSLWSGGPFEVNVKPSFSPRSCIY